MFPVFIDIYVGGVKFSIEKATILKYPDTRLGQLNSTSEEFVAEKGYFFFNRNPEMFQMILDFYRHDTLHIQSSLCTIQVENELKFWNIPLGSIAECCRSKFLKSENDMDTIQRIKSAFGMHGFKRMGFAEKGKKNRSLREKIWLFLEEPMSSKGAKMYNICYTMIVLLSVIMVFLLTFPGIRVPWISVDGFKNLTSADGTLLTINEANQKEVLAVTTWPPKWWYIIDYTLLGFFTLEFIIRLIASPNKREFCTTFLNILDLLLNVSMWFRLIIKTCKIHYLIWKYKSMEYTFAIAYCMISLRLLRIFRINKQYKELKVLFLSLRSSSKELTLLLVIFLVLAALFANFIYYAEFHEPTTFPTAFSGLWWAIVTLTTVGFGDAVPKTTVGKIVGGMCAACGLIILALPIAIIASKFNDHYQTMKDIDSFKRKLSCHGDDAIGYKTKEGKRNQSIKP